MGYPMAASIRRKTPSSSTLYIYDIHLPSCERFITEFSSHGPIETVSSPKEAASKSQVLVSIVPGAKDVEKVYLDPVDGVIAASAAGNDGKERLMLECSTIDSATTRRVGIKLAEAGQGRYVDTPVSVCFFQNMQSLSKRPFDVVCTDVSTRAANPPPPQEH
jgi:3-hydroxyisobutyrate dehydrogenase-like beta-hydroxyacid dehydrogenase